MPRVASIANLDNLVQRYSAGESLNQLAREAGVGRNTLRSHMQRAGADIRRGANAIRPDNLTELIARYQAGESLKSLSDSTGIGRTVLKLELVMAGADARDLSEAGRVHWESVKRSGAGAVRRQLEAAWAGRRGRPEPWEKKVKRAQTVYKRGLHRGAFENEIAVALRERGASLRQQCPVGAYNIDIAFHEQRVAVEVLGRKIAGNNRRIFRERCKYLINRGWGVVFVLAEAWDDRTVVDVAAITDQLIALAEMSGSDKSLLGQYRVIGSQGQHLAGPCSDPDDVASIICTETPGE